MKLKLILITLKFSLISNMLYAQSAEWVKSLGGANQDYGNTVTVDKDENLYITGDWKGDVDFDPGNSKSMLSSIGEFNFFLLKTDSLGNYQWAKSIGCGSLVVSTGSITDKMGNLYIIGMFKDSLCLSSLGSSVVLKSLGGTDAFILKIDSLGNYQWAKSFGGPDNDGLNSISVDLIGNIYVCGAFEEKIDINPNQTINSNGSLDFFILKLNSLGNVDWSKSFGGANNDICQAMIVDKLGNIFITGSINDTVVFGSTTSIGEDDIFIVKISNLGVVKWVKTFGNKGIDWGESIAVDSYGNVYVTGIFSESVNFGNNITLKTSSIFHENFILKLDTFVGFAFLVRFKVRQNTLVLV